MFVTLLLREARRDADVSQRRLAELTGVAQSVIAAAEAGRRSLSVEVCAELLAACGWELGAFDRNGQPVCGLVEDSRRDKAGRRYPAHLDVRTTGRHGDWWGDKWAGAWGVPPRPERTFELNRWGRDLRRLSRS